MIQKLKSLFRTRPQRPFPQSQQVIEYAFTAGGIDYYQHVDEMNMPYRRALKALSIYKELDMKCDRYYLDQHLAAVDSLLNGAKFGAQELLSLQRLNDQLRERTQWIVLADHVYKLASVRYFDITENPDDYDWKYAAQKINHWKASMEVDDFFLSGPVQRLLPYLKDVNTSFQPYTAVLEQLDQAQLDHIWRLLSPPQSALSLGSTERIFWEERMTESPPSTT
jgi:hypothetical protein